MSLRLYACVVSWAVAVTAVVTLWIVGVDLPTVPVTACLLALLSLTMAVTTSHALAEIRRMGAEGAERDRALEEGFTLGYTTRGAAPGGAVTPLYGPRRS